MTSSTGIPLANYFQVQRRYLRSVNVERDLNRPEAVQGYVPTERSAEALRRILAAIATPKAHRAWTMTGVYGTGKSAFAHYLLALCAEARSPMRQAAIAIAEQAFAPDSAELAAITTHLPERGLLRAAATGRREPLTWTLVRALSNGVDAFWSPQHKPQTLVSQLTDWEVELETGGQPDISDQDVLRLLKELVTASQTSLLLVVDELGKNLEYAARHQGLNDLYLLQQIAELHRPGDDQVYFLGILHQSFAGYSERLSAVEQSEWNKVQGRFEDMLFAESPNQMTRLIGQVIERQQADPILDLLHQDAAAWAAALQSALPDYELSTPILADAYPLHPLTALVLPLLCGRYAQNDRSLFTFLTSDEPYALQQFLNAACVTGDRVPTLKLHQVYDYFVESVSGLASRTNLQKWVEVQGLIQDARDQPPAVLQLLKTIGVLNLVTSAGQLRATPQLVAWALCDRPDDTEQLAAWQREIDQLLTKGLITHRRQLNELKLWEGSDFNVEQAIQTTLEQQFVPLAELLATVHPLRPVVAQRHYTTTGNLRYFEQRYVDSRIDWATLDCTLSGADGLVVYWVDPEPPTDMPPHTPTERPLLVVQTTQLDALHIRAQEFQALQTIRQKAPELAHDGVARKEVNHRRVAAQRLLDETLAQAFDPAAGHCQYWAAGEAVTVTQAKAWQALLSDLCDRVYHQGPILDNELINRRDLTSQGAKARRVLIEAMLERGDQPRLGLTGYGPEVAMYASVLEATGIHRVDSGTWGFYPPQASTLQNYAPTRPLITSVWEAIEAFFLASKAKPRSLDMLYSELERPPFGVKPGVIPVLLAALLLYHADDVGIYKDGTFIPVLGPEHFELLVKDPSRFSVKYFEMVGLRSEVFRDLENILRSPNAKAPVGVRNASLLMVAKTLFSFVCKLPKYTLRTSRISHAAQQVLAVLQQAQEPDELLFVALPSACGLMPITATDADRDKAKAFRKQLVQCLHEIQTAYDTLLSFCQTRIYEAFGVRQAANLREDLQVQTTPLVGKCIEPVLKRFILAAVNQTTADKEWLEALAMIVADKPPKSWQDTDITRFELNLGDLVRRFRNLEALQKDMAATGAGFEAQRITITEPDGHEVHQVLWVDQDDEELVEQIVARVQEEFAQLGSPRLQQAALAKLNKYVLVRDVKNSLESRSPSEKQTRKIV